MYLRLKDYSKTIQRENLLQVISNDETLRLEVELAAQEEAESYLKGKYDTTKEFTNTNPYSSTKTYYAGDRVELLGYPAYNAATSYLLSNKTVVFNGNDANQIKANTTGVFDQTKWYLLGPINTIFYLAYPKPLFDFYKYYAVGDEVFWNNKTYTARIATSQIDHQTLINAARYQNLPQTNVFPDDPVSGALVWGTGTAYSVNNKIPGTDAEWILGDNRSQQMVMMVCDLALYHLHSRIAPMNIPELRVKRRDEAIQWFKAANRGDIIPNLPLIQPRSGGRIVYDGNVKNINTY